MSTTETKVRKPRAPKVTTTPQLRAALPKKEDGSLDWRKIVSPSNLMLNQNYWASKGTDINALEEEEQKQLLLNAPDEGVLILLAGFRELGKARGVISTKFELLDRTNDRAVVSCTMVLTPNEEEPYEVTISGLGNCTEENTTSKFFVFADVMAGNRAECRAWRQYFNFTTVSYEEINHKEAPTPVKGSGTAVATLLSRMKDHNRAPESIRELIAEAGLEEPEKWSGQVEGLDGTFCFSLLAYLQGKSKEE